MGRKRKVPVIDEEKENEDASVAGSQIQITHNSSTVSTNSTIHHGPMYTIMSNVQLNETFHKKYIKEMQQLYAKMDHDAFIFTFIKMIKSAMEADEGNDYANTTLIFCAKFVSSYDGEDTHPILVDICKWLLTTISHNPHIRFRLCQFVNMILNALGAEAALDDVICDNIMEYMLARLRDVSPSVRVQAILALQRLQVPDNPDDPVLRSYQFHLCSDPSPRVRQAVITSMGRNYNTIPYILDRLWDIDEKVRRHTYLHMSSYPVKSYKVSQRLTLMEQGLNDRSEMVRKVVITIMLQQWIESYQKNLILLVSGLKLDSNEAEIDRFRKITKLTLKEIFKRQPREDLIACIPLEEDGEFHKCVPHEKLTIEISLYWQCLAEYLQSEMADELDVILPELSTFCAYVERYCESQKSEMDKFEQMEFQYILLSLMEILYTYDLGDEIGRENLKKLITTILKNCNLYENIIDVIIKCAENLITDQNIRLQYFVEIIQDICGLNTKHNDLIHDRNLINELMEKSSDAALNLKLSSLKFKILELEEQEMNFVEKKDYVNAHKITEEKNACSDEYSNLLKPLLEQHTSSDSNSASLPLQQTKKVTNESILKSLQIAFYMVVSKNVQSLTPNVCKLYNDFICRHIASNQIAIRDWALKCGTAYSMLYEALSKDVFEELYSQFYKNHNIRIWKTAITCIFELLDRYGMTSLVAQEQPNKSKKTGRLLYNTLEILDSEDEVGTSTVNQGVDVIFMMSHFLDTCDDICIMSAIINGFCRLILRGHIKNSEIIEKLLLRYFNPATDPEINQILGVFLENLIQRKKQDLLYPCLLPTVSTVMSAPYDSPLQEIKPETITRFVIDATRQEFCSSDSKIHNKLAEMFLQEMQNNSDNKDLCKLLAKELITLELNVAESQTFKQELKSSADKLLKIEFDPKTIKNIIDFKDLIDGVFNPPAKNVNENGSEDEDKSDDETVTNSEKEMPRTSTDKIPDNLDNSKNNTTEVTLTDEPEKQTVEETQSTESNKIVSPSAAIPTTYGRDNTVGIPYLRKSLNISRNNSISECGDGPSRPPKIRIEARIDSDKKAQTKDQKKLVLRNSRVRRNLRQNGDEETASQNEDQTNDTEMLAERLSDEGSSQVSDSGDKPKSPPRRKSFRQKRTEKQNNGEKNNIKVQEGTSEIRQGTRVTRRRGAAVVEKSKGSPHANKNQSPEDHVEAVSEELNNSDVIPPSPTTHDINQTSILTRKRAVLGKSISLRSTRSNTSLVPTTPKTSTETIDNGAGGGGGSPKSTPLRNGRKRVLHPSPKSPLSSESALSPMRKQSKIDKSSSKIGGKSPLPAASKSTRRSKRAEPPVSDGSPSSTKENEISNQPSTVIAGVSTIPSIADDEVTSSSQSEEAINKTPKNKQSMSFQPTSSQVKRIRHRPGFVVIDRISNSGINTRNTARQESQSRTIMTRKRLSMENQPTSSASSVKSLSPARVQPVKKAVKKHFHSKIPVRSKHKEASSSSTSSENASSSSGADDSSSTKSSGPRRALTTKMTKINLVTSKNGPVPMRLARPTRAKSPPSGGPTGSRYSRRRPI